MAKARDRQRGEANVVLPPPGHPRSHERDAVAIGRVLIIGGTLLAFVSGCVVAVGALEHGFARWFGRVPGVPPVESAAQLGGPRLQPTPHVDLHAYKAEKQALLERYRWIDRARGVVAMPIEQAMRIIAERTSRRASQ